MKTEGEHTNTPKEHLETAETDLTGIENVPYLNESELIFMEASAIGSPEYGEISHAVDEEIRLRIQGMRDLLDRRDDLTDYQRELTAHCYRFRLKLGSTAARLVR